MQEPRDPDAADLVMLVRQCRSRNYFYFLRRLFDYSISLTKDTIVKLGLARTFRIGCCSTAMPSWRRSVAKEARHARRPRRALPCKEVPTRRGPPKQAAREKATRSRRWPSPSLLAANF